MVGLELLKGGGRSIKKLSTYNGAIFLLICQH
jgi:hypothetical protein